MSNLNNLRIISSYIQNLSHNDQVLTDLLAMSIGRVIAKEHKNIEIIDLNFLNEKYDTNTINHIIDWLKVAIINGDDWISETDNKNRPKKLMKFGSIEQISQEADKAMHKRNQKTPVIVLNEGEEKIADQLENGYYLVELTTPEALDNEGVVMQHCIGQGSYDEDLESGDSMFLSLRDSFGNPHATIQLSCADNNHGTYEILQIQGKQNKLPDFKYMKLISAFLKKNTNNFARYMMSNHALVTAENGEFYNVKSIPENTTIVHFIHNSPVDIQLPKGLVVKDIFNISRSGITSLPNDIKIEGNFIAQSSRLKSLPDGLIVGKNVSLGFQTQTIKMGDNIKIGGNLNIKGNVSIEFGGNLQVGKKLQISKNKEIRNLPADIKIGGDLELEHSWIENIPLMEIGGDMNFYETYNLKELPEGLKCNGVLNLYLSGINKLPSDIQVKKFIMIHKSFNTLNLNEDFPENIRFAISNENKYATFVSKTYSLEEVQAIQSAYHQSAPKM